MTTLEKLFEQLEADSRHQWWPALDPTAIDRFDEAQGYNLPNDLKAFFRRYERAKFHIEGEYSAYRYIIGPIESLHPTWIDVYGDPALQRVPSWVSVCDQLDGDYIALDVSSGDGDARNYIDCFHEVFAVPGYCRVVARSFAELLANIISEQTDTRFYQESDFGGYGDAIPLTASTASIRIDGPDAPEHGWLVSFKLKDTLYHEFYADAGYGGAEAALAAVQQYVDGALRAASRSDE